MCLLFEPACVVSVATRNATCYYFILDITLSLFAYDLYQIKLIYIHTESEREPKKKKKNSQFHSLWMLTSQKSS